MFGIMAVIQPFKNPSQVPVNVPQPILQGDGIGRILRLECRNPPFMVRHLFRQRRVRAHLMKRPEQTRTGNRSRSRDRVEFIPVDEFGIHGLKLRIEGIKF